MLQIMNPMNQLKCRETFRKSFLLLLPLLLLVQHMPSGAFYSHLSTEFFLKQCKWVEQFVGKMNIDHAQDAIELKDLYYVVVRKIQFRILTESVNCHLLHYTMETILSIPSLFSRSLTSFEKEHS